MFQSAAKQYVTLINYCRRVRVACKKLKSCWRRRKEGRRTSLPKLFEKMGSRRAFWASSIVTAGDLPILPREETEHPLPSPPLPSPPLPSPPLPSPPLPSPPHKAVCGPCCMQFFRYPQREAAASKMAGLVKLRAGALEVVVVCNSQVRLTFGSNDMRRR